MHYDALIIGTGQAGFPLASKLAERGKTVAIADGGFIGGTCVNVGCSPTKTLVASARVAHMARRAADFGILTGEIGIDFAKVMQRQKAIVKQFNQGVESQLADKDNITLYRKNATFLDPHTVQIGDEKIEADQIYINTGARATIPDIEGLKDVPYLTNVSILDLTELPEHLIILGGGYIGLEFAQIFRRLGSNVTVLNRGAQILDREDADMATIAREVLEREGIRIVTEASVERVDNKNPSIQVHVKTKNGAEVISGSHLLVATGRTPNSDSMALNKAGVQVDKRGYITVDDELRTNVPHIWALGDVNGRGAFTHTSYNDFEIIFANLDKPTRKVSDRHMTYAVYMDPPLGRVGMNEKEARESGRKILMATKPMSHISRALERDETDGLIKILVDAETEQFLGAVVFGIGGDEIIHSIIDLMYAKAPYTVMKNAVHIHPTVSELLPTTLGELKPLE
jgi:pyruvate/2-oxoglutarate dehydrogenase complex dihydrolipoamide dehydrogenase (E3) component